MKKSPAETIAAIVAANRPTNPKPKFTPAIMEEEDAHKALIAKLKAENAILRSAVIHANRIGLAWMQDENKHGDLKLGQSANYDAACQFQQRMSEALRGPSDPVIKAEARIAKERGENAGLLDVARYDRDPKCFEETSNPYCCDTEAARYEAWAEGYENTFEANKRRP